MRTVPSGRSMRTSSSRVASPCSARASAESSSLAGRPRWTSQPRSFPAPSPQIRREAVFAKTISPAFPTTQTPTGRVSRTCCSSRLDRPSASMVRERSMAIPAR